MILSSIYFLQKRVVAEETHVLESQERSVSIKDSLIACTEVPKVKK